MTGFRHHLRNGVASLAIAAALWQQPASAETWEVVVPPNMPRSAELKAELWDFFLRGMAPGDGLTLHDGLFPRELARVEIPDDPRFDAQRARTKGLARETATLARRIDALGAGDSGEFRYRIAFPEFAFAYANSRTGGESHMLVITSGMHHAPLEPEFSLRHRGGELVLPNDAHIEAPLSESPYGTRDRGEALKGVVAHFCLMAGDDEMTTHQKDELRRFWSLYVSNLGGEMATFTESLSGCFDRWRGKIRGGLPREVLDASNYVMGMRNVTRTSTSDARPRPRGGPQSGLEDLLAVLLQSPSGARGRGRDDGSGLPAGRVSAQLRQRVVLRDDREPGRGGPDRPRLQASAQTRGMGTADHGYARGCGDQRAAGGGRTARLRLPRGRRVTGRRPDHTRSRSVIATSAAVMPGSDSAWPAVATISSRDPGHASCRAWAVCGGQIMS